MEENKILDAIIANNNAIAALTSKIDCMDNTIAALTTTMNEKFDAVDKKFDAVDARFDAMENDITKIKVTLEHDVADKISALFDGYTQNNNRLDRIDASLANLSIPVSDLNLYRRMDKMEVRLDLLEQNHA